jgi:hypothetical protein
MPVFCDTSFINNDVTEQAGGGEPFTDHRELNFRRPRQPESQGCITHFMGFTNELTIDRTSRAMFSNSLLLCHK